MTTNQIKLLQALMAALLFLSTAGDLANLLPGNGARWVALLAGAASAGVGIYTAQVGTTPADWRQPYRAEHGTTDQPR